MRQFSATYMKALKDALTAAFWYKNELRNFLEDSVSDQELIASLDWEQPRKKKVEIVDDLLKMMSEQEAIDVDDIELMTRGILEITEYRSFDKLDDKEFRLREAKRTKEILRKVVEEHAKNFDDNKKFIELDHLRAELERREREDLERSRRRAEDDKLREKDPAKYYGRLLGLKGKVTKDLIKQRHRELIKLYHPDRFSSLDEEFVELANHKTQQINEAFQFLVKKHKI